MAQAPHIHRTRYAKCGDMDIAYQVLGDGPTDLLVLPGPFVPIDSIDDEPSLYRFHRRLASFSRVIRLDHRGVGLSSRLAAITTLGPKFWAQDAIAVMDAVGCEQATIFAPSFHAMNGLVLAADYPERVRSLIVVNGSARPLWAPDYPVGAQVRRADPFLTVALEPDAVEQGFDVLSIVAPTVAGDDVFRAWWDLAGNRAGPPSMARAVSKVIAEADVRDVLGHIEAPTLILHRVGSTYIPVGHGRYLAEHIAGSRLVELPGTDTLYWVGDTGPMLDEIEEFITGVRGGADAERMLATIMFTDIVGSTQHAAALGDDRWRDLLDNHDTIVCHEIQRFGGREVNTAGDGFVATFTSPSAAIACADDIVDAVAALGIEVRIGIHAGEVEVRDASHGTDVAGVAVHIGARVCALAGPSEVLVSSTVRDIVAGSRHRFAERGEQELKGVPGRWRLCVLMRDDAAGMADLARPGVVATHAVRTLGTTGSRAIGLCPCQPLDCPRSPQATPNLGSMGRSLDGPQWRRARVRLCGRWWRRSNTTRGASPRPPSTCRGDNVSMIELEVHQADVTKLELDAITNAANTRLRHAGGVAAAIARAGGPELQRESTEKAPIGLGEAVETTAGDMPARYVIHAATMELGGPTSGEIITAATAATLRKADELGCRSLALVAFGTGVGGFPLDDAARLMVGAVRRHRPGSLQRVVFAVHGDAAERAFSAAIQAGEDTARR